MYWTHLCRKSFSIRGHHLQWQQHRWYLVSVNGTRKYSSLHILQGGPLPKGWAGKIMPVVTCLNRLLRCLTVSRCGYRDPSRGYWTPSKYRRPSSPLRHGLSTPKAAMETWGERMLMPFLPLTILSWLPLEFVRRFSFPSMTVAIGQVVMIRSDAYRTAGGFEAIPAELVDDMALATLFKKIGLTVRFIDGFEVAHCRMYDSIQSIWHGFSKYVFGSSSNHSTLIFVICLYTACFILPFCLLPWYTVLSPTLQLVTLASVGCNFIIRWLMVARYSHSWLYSLLHPFASIVVVGIFINSGIQTLLGNVQWKGRTYDNVKIWIQLSNSNDDLPSFWWTSRLVFAIHPQADVQ